MGKEGVDESAAAVSGRRVDDHPAGFIDDDKVAVLIDGRKRYVLRQRVVRRGAGLVHGNNLAGGYSVAFLCGYAVDGDAVLYNKPFNGTAG
jgi:hypothetical protein